MRAAPLLALALALCGCGLFPTTFPDVCSKFSGQTCIALGIGCDGDVQVDQIELQSNTPGLLPNGDATFPMPASTVHLPAVVAILPDPTLAGGSFTISINASLRGNPIVTDLEVQGSVMPGTSTRVNASSDTEVCLTSNVATSCNGCPGCCVNHNCVQQFLGCSSDTVCLASPSGNGFSCQPCGGEGQVCCGGAKCNTGCCNSGNPGGTCVPVNSVCSTTGAVLYCLPQAGASPGCRRCGDFQDTCCPGADGGAGTCAPTFCCDPGTNSCMRPGDPCHATNTSCQNAGQCAPCGASNEVCCPPNPAVPGSGPMCISSNCNQGTGMCP